MNREFYKAILEEVNYQIRSVYGKDSWELTDKEFAEVLAILSMVASNLSEYYHQW